LAADYATRRPQRVERLALLCPVGFGRLKASAPLAALALMLFGRRGRRAAIGLMLAPVPQPTPQDEEYAEFMILVSRHFRPRRSAPVFDDATVQRLDMPTLVFVGGRDRLIDSHETRRRLARLVPDATIRLLPDAGHALPRQTLPILEFLGTPDEAASHG
jgi:pimeloyl-ACP methyl ester carboxylesterase